MTGSLRASQTCINCCWVRSLPSSADFQLTQHTSGFFDYYGTFDATKSVVSIHIPSYDRPQPYDAEAAEAGLPPSAYGESRGVPPRFAPPSCHEWPAPFNGNKLIVQVRATMTIPS